MHHLYSGACWGGTACTCLHKLCCLWLPTGAATCAGCWWCACADVCAGAIGCTQVLRGVSHTPARAPTHAAFTLRANCAQTAPCRSSRSSACYAGALTAGPCGLVEPRDARYGPQYVLQQIKPTTTSWDHYRRAIPSSVTLLCTWYRLSTRPGNCAALTHLLLQPHALQVCQSVPGAPCTLEGATQRGACCAHQWRAASQFSVQDHLGQQAGQSYV